MSLKVWKRQKLSHLKWRKRLPCFASIIQQQNSPLGFTEWDLRPLNESKSWAAVSHACLSWNNIWLTHTSKPALQLHLKTLHGAAGLTERLSHPVGFSIQCISTEKHDTCVLRYVIVNVMVCARDSEWMCVCGQQGDCKGAIDTFNLILISAGGDTDENWNVLWQYLLCSSWTLKEEVEVCRCGSPFCRAPQQGSHVHDYYRHDHTQLHQLL